MKASEEDTPLSIKHYLRATVFNKTRNLETKNQKPKIRNQKPETQNQNLEPELAMIDNDQIKASLIEKFGENVSNFQEPYGMLTFESPKELNLKVLQFLFDESQLKFRFLTDLQAVHYPDQKGKELAVVYHLHNLEDNIRIRFKVFTDIGKPDVFTATNLFSAANWMERETYDFFGVNFVGHPNLKRILNVDEMDYFPMRKEYPLEEQTRIDKDDEMFGRGGTIS